MAYQRVHGKIGAATVKFAIDTLYSETWIWSATVRKAMAPVPGVQARSSSGRDIEILRPDSIRAGEWAYRRPLCHYSLVDPTEPEVTLGLEPLKGVRLTLDKARGLAFFEQLSDRPGEGTKWFGVGISPGPSGADGVPIEVVIYPSPAAEAGIEPGEVIVSIDGTAVGGLPPSRLAPLWKKKEGEKLRLRVRGKQGEREVVLRVRELL